MKSYKEYLQEKMSSVVFHKTSISNALKILNDNRFRLSVAIGTEAERKLNKDKIYFLSVARSTLSSYVAQEPMTGDLYFVLDGDKFNQKYKSSSQDYWGPEFRKIDPTKNEMEDRLFSDKQYIEDAKSYIKEIHVFVEETKKVKDYFGENETVEVSKIDGNQFRILQQLYSVAKKNDIPVYFYTDSKSFTTRNKNKSVNALQWLKDNDGFKPKEIPRPYFNRGNYFADWMELLNFPIEKYNVQGYDDYKKRIKDLLTRRSDRLLFDYILYNSHDGIKSLKNDIHNKKSSDEIGKFIDTMRKYKLRNAEEVIGYLKDKWKDIKD